MDKKTITEAPQISELIKTRRKELELTIEEAASKAGVGTKTWWRYESGGSIRKDKIKGICKALNWHALPDEHNDSGILFDIEEYKKHDAWSEYICENYGIAAAISFAIGCDILLDNIEEDLHALSSHPRGTHIGQLPASLLESVLPEQFLMRYDYEFLCCLRSTIKALKKSAHHNIPIVAHAVIQELALYLIVQESVILMDAMYTEMEEHGIEDIDYWREWIFDIFDDMDIITFLYSDIYVSCDNTYHFDNWTLEQFYVSQEELS